MGNSNLEVSALGLGYDIIMCGADVANPGVHLANIVRLGGREYLVNAGYGAPFLQPLPRDLDHDYEIVLGKERYVLKPQDTERKSRLQLYRRGKPAHGYIVKPAPLERNSRTAVWADMGDPLSLTFL